MPRPTNDPATPERGDVRLDAPPLPRDAELDALPQHDTRLDAASPRRDAAEDASLRRRDSWFARPRWSWNIIALVCLVAATIALLNSYIDAAFVTATLGVVAWFLEARNKYKVARVESDDADLDAESELEEDRDEY